MFYSADLSYLKQAKTPHRKIHDKMMLLPQFNIIFDDYIDVLAEVPSVARDQK
jgi:hypothetical protein